MRAVGRRMGQRKSKGSQVCRHAARVQARHGVRARRRRRLSPRPCLSVLPLPQPAKIRQTCPVCLGSPVLSCPCLVLFWEYPVQNAWWCETSVRLGYMSVPAHLIKVWGDVWHGVNGQAGGQGGKVGAWQVRGAQAGGWQDCRGKGKGQVEGVGWGWGWEGREGDPCPVLRVGSVSTVEDRGEKWGRQRWEGNCVHRR